MGHCAKNAKEEPTNEAHPANRGRPRLCTRELNDASLYRTDTQGMGLLLAVDVGHKCSELCEPFLGVLVHGLAAVKSGDLCHLLIAQSEVEEIEVLRNVGWGLRAGDHDVSLLDVPA